MLIQDIILENEKKFSLYEKKIGDINYWVYNRFIVQQYIDTLKNHLGAPHRKERLSGKLILEDIKYVCSSFLYPKRNLKNVDVFLLNHPRRIMREGKYECPYSSMLASKLDNVLMYERLGDHRHVRPTLEDHVYYADKVALFSSLSAEFHSRLHTRKYLQVYRQMEKESKEAVCCILRECGLNEKESVHIIQKMTRNYFAHQYKYTFYKKLLNDISPKAVIEVVSYSADCMAVTDIAKQLHIPTIELQHGVIVPEHIAYNYGDQKNIQQFPEYALVFSKYWRDIMKAPIEKDHIFPVGYPFLERGIQEARDKVGKVEKKGICFLSSGDVGEEFSRLAQELSQKLDSEEWNIFYKLHPGEFAGWKETYPWLLDTDVIVVDGEGMSLYEVFTRSDYQIGVASTAIYEGMAFGLTTLIYHIYTSEYMENICRLNYARYVENADEIKQIIAGGNLEQSDGRWFWESDSLNKAVAAVKYIMDTNN